MVKAMLAKSVSKEKHSVSVIRTNTVCDCVKYSTGNALKHSLSENNLIKTNILYPTRNKHKHLKKGRFTMVITTLPKADRQKLFFQAEIIAKYKKTLFDHWSNQ